MRLSITAPLISAALIATALCPVVNAQEVNATATDIDTRHANEAASPTGPLPVIHVDDSMPPAVTVPPEDSQSIPEVRSEEHTSELQSLMRISYAVFCLKKKKHKTQRISKQNQTSLKRTYAHTNTSNIHKSITFTN